MQNEFSDYYQDYLTSCYDCVDRIVLNAYCIRGCIPGGFRLMWRELFGSDETLDNTHLMRLAQRTGRRIRAYAKANNIPVVDCHKSERKDNIAADYLPDDPAFTGLFLILVGRAPASVWDVQHTKEGKIRNIARKKQLSFVNHYHFHIMDAEWGHIIIRLCGHPPFSAQVILNGHEYVASHAKKLGIEFTKEDNCFTEIADAARLCNVADTLSQSGAIGRLSQVCERWLYTSCLCFALSSDEQKRCEFNYQYFVYQAEYSRNLLFKRGSDLDQVFHGIVDRTRRTIAVKTLRTIFGAKHRPHWNRKKKARVEVVIERPTYDLTVFKIHFDKLTAKLYTKGEHVLRIEVITHNARAMKLGCSLPKFTEVIVKLRSILERFLETMHWMDTAAMADSTMDELSTSSQIGASRVGGIDINKHRTRAVMEAVIELSVHPYGFTSSQLAEKVRERFTAVAYTPKKAAYDLKKFRAKELVSKKEKSRKYYATQQGLKTMVALLTLREKVIKPILTVGCKITRRPKPKNQSPLDIMYRNIQIDMINLFSIVGISV